MTDARGRPLRVGVDGRALEPPRTGVGRYVFEMGRALGELLPDAEFVVYARRPVPLPGSATRWRLHTEPIAAARRLPASAWLRLRAGTLARSDALDVFWAAAALHPGPRAPAPVVSTVYDLNHVLVPETVPASHRWVQRLLLPRDARRAHTVVAISEGTRARLAHHHGVAGALVARPAASEAFAPPDAAQRAAVRARHGLPARYALAVATWEPRKNLGMLLDAFRAARDAGRLGDLELVLVGGRGWDDAAIAARAGGAERGVRALGFVADEELPALYAEAAAFVFPSRYEGFGIPVLEARLAGAAVVATDLPELREAGGEAATYVPATVEALGAALERAARGELPRAPGGAPPWRWIDSAAVLAGALRAAARAPRG